MRQGLTQLRLTSKTASSLPCSSKDDFEPGSNIQLFKAVAHIFCVYVCIHSHVHTCLRMYMPWHMCGGHMTTYRSQLSPSCGSWLNSGHLSCWQATSLLSHLNAPLMLTLKREMVLLSRHAQAVSEVICPVQDAVCSEVSIHWIPMKRDQVWEETQS